MKLDRTWTSIYRTAATIAALLSLLAKVSWAAALVGREIVIEPDDYPHLQLLDNVSPQVTLSTGAFSDNRPTFDVRAYSQADNASTGTKVFAHGGGIPFWNTSRTFRMDFHSPVTNIRLDYIGSGFFDESYRGRLEAYSPAGILVDSYLTAPLAEGQFETMVVKAPQIAWALAYPPEDPFGDLDYLRFTVVPEPGTVAMLAVAVCGSLLARRRSGDRGDHLRFAVTRIVGSLRASSGWCNTTSKVWLRPRHYSWRYTFRAQGRFVIGHERSHSRSAGTIPSAFITGSCKLQIGELLRLVCSSRQALQRGSKYCEQLFCQCHGCNLDSARCNDSYRSIGTRHCSGSRNARGLQVGRSRPLVGTCRFWNTGRISHQLLCFAFGSAHRRHRFRL